MLTALSFISTAEATDTDCNGDADTISVTSPPIVVPPDPAKLPIKAVGLARFAVKTKEKIKNKETPKGYLAPISKIFLKMV